MKLKELYEGTNFANTSTTSLNKISIDKAIYSKVNLVDGDGVMMLVGAADGLKRHLDAFTKDLNLKNLSNLWIIDSQLAVIAALEKEFEKLKDEYTGTPHFIVSDAIAFLNSNPSAKEIKFVDFDGTTGAGNYHIELYQTCLNLNVKYISLIGSSRSGNTKNNQMVKLVKDFAYPEDHKYRNINKASQEKKGFKYSRNRKELGWGPLSASDILNKYLVDDSGQNCLFYKTYGGARNTSMWAMLFEIK